MELNTPPTDISKVLNTFSKLAPKSGVISLFAIGMQMIAKTIYKLRTALKNEENLKELSVLGNDTGKTKQN
jgi:hypothetical protein